MSQLQKTLCPLKRKQKGRHGFLYEHSLQHHVESHSSLLDRSLHFFSNPDTHWGSFFGNAIAARLVVWCGCHRVGDEIFI